MRVKIKHLRAKKLRWPDYETYSFGKAVRHALKRKEVLGLPIARYEQESDRAYLEYPDGRREYIEA